MASYQSGLYTMTRTQVIYTDEQQRLLECELRELNAQIDKNEINKSSIIYDNQENAALKVVAAFRTWPLYVVNCLVVAKTQSGKTGAMIAICKQYTDKHKIPNGNIYIITGHSSTAWKKQTKGRFPECLEKNIYHRPDFGKKNGSSNKLVEEIKGKKDILFIMDEVHVAAKKGQSLHSLFKKLGFDNLGDCLKNDIKIVEFSATPDGTVYDLNDWGKHAKLIQMKAGDTYIGAHDLLLQKRVMQFKDLCCFNKTTGEYSSEQAIENIREICIKSYDEPMYHIIRTPPAGHQDEVINMFKIVHKDCEFKKFNGETKKSEELNGINDILKDKPKKHTFIFIKEMLRMAVTLHKEHLGILYERFTKNSNDSVIIQGLIGRATGYDDNKKTYIFTNIDSIIKYRNLWIYKFSPELMVLWKSNTTKSNGDGGTESRETFNIQSTTGDSKEDNVPDKPPEIKIIKSQDELKEWFAKELKPKGYGSGPRRKKQNKDGFYECITQDCKTWKVRNITEFEKIKKENSWGFKSKTQKSKAKNKYRLYPCYGDIKKKKTLQWWFVYY